MTDFLFEFHGLRLAARPSGALFWPEGGWLMVADLHLGKSGRMARRGGALLPPYETAATLARLRDEIAATGARRVLCLGDSFDDDAARNEIAPEISADLHRMGRDWGWITGNHDPAGADPRLPGTCGAEIMLGPVTLRHQAGQGPDISGHFHPVVRLAGERRRAFLIGAAHVILPAFGAYTGGLLADDPAIRAILPSGIAVACGARCLVLPLNAKRAGLTPRVRNSAGRPFRS